MVGMDEGLWIHISLAKIAQKYETEQGVMCLWAMTWGIYRAFLLLLANGTKCFLLNTLQMGG